MSNNNISFDKIQNLFINEGLILSKNKTVNSISYIVNRKIDNQKIVELQTKISNHLFNESIELKLLLKKIKNEIRN